MLVFFPFGLSIKLFSFICLDSAVAAIAVLLLLLLCCFPITIYELFSGAAEVLLLFDLLEIIAALNCRGFDRILSTKGLIDS